MVYVRIFFNVKENNFLVKDSPSTVDVCSPTQEILILMKPILTLSDDRIEYKIRIIRNRKNPCHYAPKMIIINPKSKSKYI